MVFLCEVWDVWSESGDLKTEDKKYAAVKEIMSEENIWMLWSAHC